MKVLIVLAVVLVAVTSAASSVSSGRSRRHVVLTEAQKTWFRSKRWDDEQAFIAAQKRLFLGDWAKKIGNKVSSLLDKAKIVATSLTHGIYPGTKWCGRGKIARSYNDLGTGNKRKADMCCREHDHCPQNIPARSTKYGVRNNQVYTMSACSCDRKFRDCLRGNNDFTSKAIGTAFFTVLRTACFENGRTKNNSFKK